MGEEREEISFTKTTAVYIPSNVPHQPIYKKVEKPMFLEAMVAGGHVDPKVTK